MQLISGISKRTDLDGLADFIEDHFLTCAVKKFTGLNCPGCGTQRAFVALLRGDLEGSFQLQPALIPLIITVLFTIIHLRFGFRHGASTILVLFSISVSLMIVNFVAKSLLPL